MNDVFISYSRRDKVFVQKLYDCLTNANRSVWADWDSIPAASDWFAEIKQGIQETDSVVFVLSPEWIKSNECRKELNYAVEMGKRLFPILYIAVDPKDVPPELGKINWVYMRDTDDFDKAFQTLCSAMDTDLDWIKTHTRIQVRALEWEKKNRSSSFALHGEDLTEGEQFIAGAANKNPVPTHLQSEYILASRTDATRRQRQTLVGVTVALVISIALGIIAFFQRQEAVTQRAEAVKQSQISLARQLAAQAQSVKLTGSEQIAALLGVQSMKIYPTGDAANFLIDALFARPVASMKHKSDVLTVAFSPDGKYVASGSIDGTGRIWEAHTGKEVAHFTQAGFVVDIDFSSNGKFIVSLGNDGNAYIREVVTGNELSHISDLVNAVSFSPNGKNIVSSGCDKYDAVNSSCAQYTVSNWEIATGKKLNSIAYDDQGDFSRLVAFSADGKYMVSAGSKYIHVLEIDSGRETAHILHSIAGGVRSLAFSPSGEYVVAGGNDGTARVWEIAVSREVARMTMSLGDPVSSVAFSPDGRYVASGSGEWSKSPLGSRNNTIRVWKALTGMEVTRITQNSPVYSIAFSPDGNFIVSTECDKQDENFDCSQGLARVWEIRTDRERMSQEGDLRSAVFSPDGKYVASLGDAVLVWEPFTGRRIASFKHEEYTSSCAFSPDGKYIVTTGCDKNDADYNCIQGSARVWEFATGKEVSSMAYKDYVPFAAFSPDGKYIVTAGCDKSETAYTCIQGSARVWEFATGKEVSSMAHKGYVHFVAFSSDGKNIISTDDHTVVVWEASTGKEISQTSDKDNVIHAIGSDGKYVVSSRCDQVEALFNCIQGFTRLWNAETGEDIVSLMYDTGVVTFSPDGKYAILANCIKRGLLQNCTQSTLDELETATGKEIIQITFEGYMNSVAFSPDGKHMVLEKGDGTAQVWEAATGKEIARITHTSAVGTIVFSPDGKYVVSEFGDGSARVWELLTGKEIAYTRHAGSVSAVAFSPNGKYVVSGGCIESNMVGCTKSSVRVWLWQPEDIIVNVCAYLPRNLTRAEWAQFIGDAMPYQAVCENLPIESEFTTTPTATP